MEIFSSLTPALQPHGFSVLQSQHGPGEAGTSSSSQGVTVFSVGTQPKATPSGQWLVLSCPLHNEWSAQGKSEVSQPPIFIVSPLLTSLTSEDTSPAALDSSPKSHAFFMGKPTTIPCSWIACKSPNIVFPTRINQYFHRGGKKWSILILWLILKDTKQQIASKIFLGSNEI